MNLVDEHRELGNHALRSAFHLGKGFFLVTCIVVFQATGAAQGIFQRDHGYEWRRENGYSVVEGNNLGYFIGGTMVDSIWGRGVLLKILDNGDSLWWRGFSIDGTSGVLINQLLPTDDGGLILAGQWSHDLEGDVLVLRLDTMATVLWISIVGDTTFEAGMAICKASGSGYLCAGVKSPGSGPEQDFYVVRLNSLGDTLWTRTYGDPDDPQKAYAIAPLSDTNWVVVGDTDPSTTTNYIWALRINDQGDTLWTRTISEFGDCYATDAETLPNDHILITGFSLQFGCARPLLLELDGNGDLLWYQNYDNGVCDWGYAMCKTVDGYAVFSSSDSYGLRLTRTDLDGEEMWSRSFDVGTQSDRGYDVQATDDGGFVLTGVSLFTSDVVGTDFQIFIIKTDSLGNVTTSTQDINLERSIAAMLFPNPAEDQATFRFNSTNGGAYTLRLHDATGRVVRTYAQDLDLSPGQHDLPIELNGLSRGGYTLVLSHAGRSVAVKAIKR